MRTLTLAFAITVAGCAPSAPTAPVCLDAGETCGGSRGECCAGSRCVGSAADGYACADSCRADEGCMSGCCAPLFDGSGAVCSGVRFCTAQVYVEDACIVFAETQCSIVERCGGDATGCRTELRDGCCTGADCDRESWLAPSHLRDCIVASETHPCSSADVPAACVWMRD